MAEWEEIKAITLSWQGYSGVLTEIVREAVEEVVIILPLIVAALKTY